MKPILMILLAVEILSAHSMNPAVADDFSDDGAYLDPRQPSLIHPTHSKSIHPSLLRLPVRTETAALIQKISPVRSQGKRGTCSIFASTAHLEALLSLRLGTPGSTLDLSEEWLEYTVMQNSNEEGSSSARNYYAFQNFGSTIETIWPYLGEQWYDVPTSLSEKRCDSVPASLKKRCLIGHRDPRLLTAPREVLTTAGHELYDPEFLKIRESAQRFRTTTLSRIERSGSWVKEIETAKALLAAGTPITLDIDFYYGAWNHRQADTLGIGRNLSHWAQGLVGFPEPGSLDRIESVKDPAGHAVLLVGYDDSRIIETQVKMKNGQIKKFSYQGVYYFKNSWGTSSFGTETLIEGKIYPGYGVISQKYAHAMGAFFKF